MVYGTETEHPVDAAGMEGKRVWGWQLPIKAFSLEDALRLRGSSRPYQVGKERILGLDFCPGRISEESQP